MKPPPDDLSRVTLMSVSDSEVELSYGSLTSSDVTYEILYREIGVCEVLTVHTTTDCTSHTITDLNPSSEYEFSVVVKIDGHADIDLGHVKVQTEMAAVGKCCLPLCHSRESFEFFIIYF